jgi:hypothetical protein
MVDFRQMNSRIGSEMKKHNIGEAMNPEPSFFDEGCAVDWTIRSRWTKVFLHTPNFHRDYRKVERAGGCLNLTHVKQGDRIAGIRQNR